MIQVQFAEKAKQILKPNANIIGLAVAGSWLTNELDEFSDLDLIVVTNDKIGGDSDKMLEYATYLGNLLSGFTGEHVGEPRLLICLYDNPLLHVDIKFLTLEEFSGHVETPVILLDKDNRLLNALANSIVKFPHPDFQWIEDRFWIWIHYTLLKIGRGEYFEALDFFSFLRMTVIGPLIHLKNGNLPRGVRKVELTLIPEDLSQLTATIPEYNRYSLLTSLKNTISLYKKLRESLFDEKVKLQTETEQKVMAYFDQIIK